MPSAFIAQFRGICAECKEWFAAGTLIKYDENNHVVHTECPDDRPVAVCPKCFLTSCDCDR